MPWAAITGMYIKSICMLIFANVQNYQKWQEMKLFHHKNFVHIPGLMGLLISLSWLHIVSIPEHLNLFYWLPVRIQVEHDSQKTIILVVSCNRNW